MQVQVNVITERCKRGIELASRGHVEKRGDLFTVRASKRQFWYTVNPERESCSCKDWKRTQEPCKHVYAVALVSARS